MRVNQFVRDTHEVAERAVECRIVDTAVGNRHWGDSRWYIHAQDRLIPQLIQSLADVRGADDVLARALRLAELKHHSSARTAEVLLVFRQRPIDMKQAGEPADVDVGSDQSDDFRGWSSQRAGHGIPGGRLHHGSNDLRGHVGTFDASYMGRTKLQVGDQVDNTRSLAATP